MTGQLTLQAPHLHGGTPIGHWFPAAWALYTDFLTRFGAEQLEALDDLWADLHEPGPDGPDAPTAETWGASEEAQNSMLGLMAELSAAGLGGAGDGG